MTEIGSRDDFVRLVRALEQKARDGGRETMNLGVPDYLEALGAWTEDMD